MICPPGWDGIPRVDGEVEAAPVQAVPHPQAPVQIRREGEFDADVLSDGSSQHRLEASHHVAEVDGPQFQHCLRPNASSCRVRT